VSENRTTQPCAAGSDRPWASDRPWGEKKRLGEKVELEAQYRRIGIGAVAAAARPQSGKPDGR